jgi:hypothetical protein
MASFNRRITLKADGIEPCRSVVRLEASQRKRDPLARELPHEVAELASFEELALARRDDEQRAPSHDGASECELEARDEALRARHRRMRAAEELFQV